MHVQQSTGATRLIFGQTLRLLPYFMCANSEGSGESGQMRSLAWAFAGCLCDKYHKLMCWLIWVTPHDPQIKKPSLLYEASVSKLEIGHNCKYS